jgi:Flp pilus assembly protein CpaB
MGRRLIFLIGALILLGAVVAVVLLSGSDNGGDSGNEPEATTEGNVFVPQGQTGNEMEGMVEIVVALQSLSRGMVIPEGGLTTQRWPISALPEPGNYFLAEDMGQVVGKIARTDIFRGSPILSRYVVDNIFDIASTGSDAAAILNSLPQDQNWVAVSIPLDPSGIGQAAYGIQDGDFVDVILSFLFIDVDPDFQTRLPNNISIITRAETGELTIGAPRQGRTEASALTPEGFLLGPSEASQRPRLVTQYTVQNAFVVHVGYFDETGKFIGLTPTPTQQALQEAPGQETDTQQQQRATDLPTPSPFTPLIITLGVTPQDALVLTWAVDSQIPITLALRAAGDANIADTEPVTLDYMIRVYNAEPPSALEFALEPPITSVRRFDIATLYDFLGRAVATE